jgi:hypothetical protein
MIILKVKIYLEISWTTLASFGHTDRLPFLVKVSHLHLELLTLKNEI